MSSTDEKIIKKYGQSEIGKKLQLLLKKVEDTPSFISDILLIAKTDENMKKIIEVIEKGIKDRNEILERTICIAEGVEYNSENRIY